MPPPNEVVTPMSGPCLLLCSLKFSSASQFSCVFVIVCDCHLHCLLSPQWLSHECDPPPLPVPRIPSSGIVVWDLPCEAYRRFHVKLKIWHLTNLNLICFVFWRWLKVLFLLKLLTEQVKGLVLDNKLINSDHNIIKPYRLFNRFILMPCSYFLISLDFLHLGPSVYLNVQIFTVSIYNVYSFYMNWSHIHGLLHGISSWR